MVCVRIAGVTLHGGWSSHAPSCGFGRLLEASLASDAKCCASPLVSFTASAGSIPEDVNPCVTSEGLGDLVDRRFSCAVLRRSAVAAAAPEDCCSSSSALPADSGSTVRSACV